MMTRFLVLIAITWVLLSAGCVKIGGEETSTTSTTSSVETTVSTTTSTLTTSISTTTVETTTSTTIKPETTYTTISQGTCYDKIKNQGEAGIDCGGPCRPCEVKCSADSDCGSEHYTRDYCKETNGIWFIMHDLVSYKCRDPGEWNASCIMLKKPEQVERCAAYKQCVFTDFCPGSTYTRCEEARCILKEDVCDWILC